MTGLRYHRPDSLTAAAELFAAGDDPRYLAGGQTLVPVLRLRLDAPSDLIDLAGIDGLVGISGDRREIVVGAMTPHGIVANDALVREHIPALAGLAGAIGDPQVRNRGTIGGSLANSDPAADWPAAVLGLGATVHTDRRAIAADDFFTGLFETALETGEIIARIVFPVPRRAGYARVPAPASGFPLAAVFAAETAGGPRLAVTGAGPCVFRLTEWEEALSGGFDAGRLAGLALAADGLNHDHHASAAYRAHLVAVMARRAVAGAAPS